MRSFDLLLVLVFLVSMEGLVHGQSPSLRINFYQKTCPNAEQIAHDIVWKRVAKNNALPAKFIRMHFHDCFVRGCDGSVLLNSTANSTAEKDSIPNLSLSGFDVIDEVKSAIEKACPGIVSCSDIVALAARDSVAYQFKKPLWSVPTGRRDGTVSLASEVFTNIPSPFSNFTTLVQNFANKGLDVKDLVVLSGAHTIGIGHCNLFSNRLYNFTGKGDADPSLNAKYASFLKTKCTSQSDTTTTVPMDPTSSVSFDTHYYTILTQNKGLFQSDAALLTDKHSGNLVVKMLDSNTFFEDFGIAMKKMGNIGVLTGNAGEIRKKCSVVGS
ncbi:Peroxidase 56 [Acorus gramineus]|uniref:Peroxidase n=1 Tax=Acorus gramineus TaxID=55184 RepID=A0AAV9BT93_ACOGR|nr:Peroxidase 56 [Acorus gramineus]